MPKIANFVTGCEGVSAQVVTEQIFTKSLVCVSLLNFDAFSFLDFALVTNAV